MNRYSVVTIFLGVLAAAGSYSQQTTDMIFDSLQLVVKGATLIKVSGQFIFTEGPAVDKKGNIYFTDQPNDKIWKYEINGRLSLFMNKTGRSNGLYFDKNGDIIACADNKDELWRITPAKKVTVLLNNFNGHRLNGPNDLWIDAKGGIYFTDPYYQRDYWDRKQPDIDGQKVYYLAKGKKEAVIADDHIKQPNGIVGTPDGKTLYVADIGDWKTYRYHINEDASLSDRQLLFSQGSDGMTLDNKGNIYVTGQGVTIYNKDGVKIGHIPVPGDWTANLCFGGNVRKTLFNTDKESLYCIQMNVKVLN